MLIAVCNDNTIVNKNIKLVCERTLKKENVYFDFRIILFSDSRELIQYAQEPDIIILDIEMPGMDWSLFRHKFQNLEKRVLIIFVAKHSETIRRAIGINVFGFIDVEMVNRRLPVLFRQAVNMIEKKIIIDRKIRSDKIKYIEADHIYSVFIMEGGSKYPIRITMKNLQNKLSYLGFVRIHRKYIVNMYWIDRVAGKKVYIEDEALPISDNHIKEVQKEYREFCIHNMVYADKTCPEAWELVF